jgi:hypothetical protein
MFGDVHTIPIFVLSKYTNNMKNTTYQIVIGKYEFVVAVVKTTKSQIALHEEDRVTYFAPDSKRYADYVYEMQESGYKFKDISGEDFRAVYNKPYIGHNPTIAISLG